MHGAQILSERVVLHSPHVIIILEDTLEQYKFTGLISSRAAHFFIARSLSVRGVFNRNFTIKKTCYTLTVVPERGLGSRVVA